jgi:hypothetical protein
MQHWGLLQEVLKGGRIREQRGAADVAERLEWSNLLQ